MNEDVFALDPENARVREVFARFGRAFYVSNCLERKIADALLFTDWRENLTRPMTRPQYESGFDHYMTMLSKMTMGQLVAKIKTVPDLPAELQKRLDICLAARNKLTHHYFWERAGEFSLSRGQFMMMKECDDLCAVFEKTGAMLDDYVGPYIARHGLTEELIESERKRIVERATEDLGSE